MIQDEYELRICNSQGAPEVHLMRHGSWYLLELECGSTCHTHNKVTPELRRDIRIQLIGPRWAIALARWLGVRLQYREDYTRDQ